LAGCKKSLSCGAPASGLRALLHTHTHIHFNKKQAAQKQSTWRKTFLSSAGRRGKDSKGNPERSF
jgi:hypothetical protein